MIACLFFFFIWSFHCPSLFDLQILITSLYRQPFLGNVLVYISSSTCLENTDNTNKCTIWLEYKEENQILFKRGNIRIGNGSGHVYHISCNTTFHEL